MNLRSLRSLRLPALFVGIIAAVSACNNGTPNFGPTPSPSPTGNNVVNFTAQGPGFTVSPAAVAAYSSTFTFPAVTAGAGTGMSFVDGVTALSGLPTLPSPGTPLLYIAWTTQANVTFSGFPSTTLTLPSNISTTGTTFYLAYFDPNVNNGAWQLAYRGPGTVSGQTVTFPGGNSSFQVLSGHTYGFVFYSTSTSSPTPSPAVSSQFIYTSNGSGPNRNVLNAYPATANGNVVPLMTVGGSNTQLNNPNGLAFDSTGKLYVANQGSAGAGSIDVFPPTPAGNIAPVATIAGPATGLSAPEFVALDASNNIYVTNNGPLGGGSDSVEIFAPGSNGNVAPSETIAGSSTGLSSPLGVAVDASGKIYVANNGNSSVTVYAALSNGNVAPLDTISGSNTLLASPSGIAVDSQGYIYVANTANNTIAIFAPGSNGNATPYRTIVGSNTLLAQPFELYIDAGGRLYDANNATSGNGNSVAVFPILPTPSPTPSTSPTPTPTPNPSASPTATPTPYNPNVPPLQFLFGGNTQLTAPDGVAAH
ncbi:MAG: NHL repeat-containing protein [Candidatus Eremiobacteraeota bacterium]|nr:NHL repeat-containing protein [Candidatus Eremiobacteraeota bacterium]